MGVEEIKNYLILSQKSEDELLVIHKSLELPPVDKSKLLDSLLELQPVKKIDIYLPQVIPLRLQKADGTEIPLARQTFLAWRKRLFAVRNINMKEFKLLTNNGKQYTARFVYLPISVLALHTIIKEGWIYPQTQQAELVKALLDTPEKFEVNIIQKKNAGKSYLMIHSQGKQTNRTMA